MAESVEERGDVKPLVLMLSGLGGLTSPDFRGLLPAAAAVLPVIPPPPFMSSASPVSTVNKRLCDVHCTTHALLHHSSKFAASLREISLMHSNATEVSPT